jgi:hypothetical protein
MIQHDLTVAQCRTLAQSAAQIIDWETAAYYWNAALERYPRSESALAKRDVEQITLKRDAARRSAKAELGDKFYQPKEST